MITNTAFEDFFLSVHSQFAFPVYLNYCVPYFQIQPPQSTLNTEKSEPQKCRIFLFTLFIVYDGITKPFKTLHDHHHSAI